MDSNDVRLAFDKTTIVSPGMTWRECAYSLALHVQDLLARVAELEKQRNEHNGENR